MTKNQIRSTLKELRNNLSSEEQQKLSMTLRDKLFQSEVYRQCDKLFTFVSFQSEVDTKELIRQSLRMGKKVYIPRVEKKNMKFYEILNLDNLIPSKYGVLEPPADEEKCYIPNKYDAMSEDTINYNSNHERSHSINLMLLPGLAFDLKGNRIGYGAGYYDRYFAANPEIDFHKLAIAYDFQVLEEIPADEFDIRAEAIITPTRFIECNI